MLTSIKGIYENGRLTLLEPAPNVEKAEVLVTFLEEAGNNYSAKRGVKLGSLEGKYSLPDDFNDPIDDLNEYM